ncbi:tautomerase enzyme [Streptomyces sp. NPDC006197]|uniref:tautomerase enzyme n=1 Tax=Streptomyces sp. NPDC006197 TaxID=3156685 RepID=UPI0033B44F2F
MSLSRAGRNAPAPPARYVITDAVLVPEVGQFAPPARVGFQAHLVEREPDMMAIGGRLLADIGPDADVMAIDVAARGGDVMAIDVAVMDGDWRQEVRTAVVERLLAAMADTCGLAKPSPTWWVDFRVVDEGSWGSGGGVTSVLALLDTGVFTEEKARAVRAALGT